MSIIVILKNTTGGKLTFSGRGIAAGGQRDGTRGNEILRDNDALLAAIDAGDIVVNDGTSDLPAAAGKAHLYSPMFGTVNHSFYVTIDRQKKDTEIPFVTTSRTLIDLDRMTITTKDLGGNGSYVITFSCIYKHEGDDKNCHFSISVDGVEVAQGIAVGFNRDKKGSFSMTHKENGVSAGSVIKVQVSQQSINTNLDELTVTSRHLVVDGMKGDKVL